MGRLFSNGGVGLKEGLLRKGGEAFALTWNIHKKDKDIKEKAFQFF